MQATRAEIANQALSIVFEVVPQNRRCPVGVRYNNVTVLAAVRITSTRKSESIRCRYGSTAELVNPVQSARI